MSWHFSQALVAEYLRANCLAGERSGLWKSIPSAPDDSCSGRMKGTFHRSPYGTMFVPSTEPNGVALLTWFREVFLASPLARPPTDAQPRLISGLKCPESSEKSSHLSCSQKTSQEKQSKLLHMIVPGKATKLKRWRCPRRTWVQTIFGSDIGFLHTPTCAGNYAAKSMQKHLNCRIFVRVFGKVNPVNQEWLMGWPIGWTASEPLATDKFQSWQQQHGLSFSVN